MPETPNPFERPAQNPAEKAETLRERVERRLREQAQMTPEERAEKPRAYMRVLKHGKKVELTPEEKRSHAEREKRVARLRQKP